jgi:hypothetical protein
MEVHVRVAPHDMLIYHTMTQLIKTLEKPFLVQGKHRPQPSENISVLIRNLSKYQISDTADYYLAVSTFYDVAGI